jgi:acyl carrier protein
MMMKREHIVLAVSALCEELDVFGGEDIHEHFTSDFFDAGVIDSMSMTYLQCAIIELYDIDIPFELFMTELRSLEQVVNYIDGLTQGAFE